MNINIEQKIRRFWQRKNILNILLLPFSLIYYLIHLIKFHLTIPLEVNAKVICIGGLVVGGSGKTPVALSIAKKIIKTGKEVAFISRGYKGNLSSNKKVIKVLRDIHSYLEVGDEPLLLSEIAPTYICKNRYLAAKKASKDGAEIIIMDDGLQNNTLKKDLSILVFDEYFIGNGLSLPAGPLREPFFKGFKKADLIINFSNNKLLYSNKKVLKANIKIINGKSIRGKQVIVMSSIAAPDKFLHTLSQLKVRILEKFVFPDHHKLSDYDLNTVINCATNNKCKIVTTTKDFVKIPKNLRNHFLIVEIEAEFDFNLANYVP